MGANGLTLGHVVRYNVLRKPRKTAIIFQDKRYTWAEFNARVNQLAHALLDAGIEKGDVVSILSLNRNEYLELYFACGKIGAVMNALNFRLSHEEIKRAIIHSESKLEIIDTFFEDLYGRITDGPNGDNRRAVFVGGEPAHKQATYEDFIRNQPEKEPAFEVDPDDPVLLQYTSGTTGTPKGALLTHNNFVWDALNSLYHSEVEFNDVLVTASPFFHCSGLHILTDTAFLKAMTIIIIPLWNAEQVCEAIQRERATLTFVMMPMMPSFLEAIRSGRYDLSSLKGIGSSAAAYTSDLYIEVLYRTGAKSISFGYGLTEAAPGVTLHENTAEVLYKQGNSLGKPTFTSEVRVVDDRGREVPKGEMGELIVRGPQVFKGYMKDKQATEKMKKNGWLYTGDLVSEDNDGNFWFKGRIKDMIKSGGENVFASEVEQCILKANPEVKEVAVYGKPDEKWGEAVAAACILNSGARLSPEELIARTRDVIAHYKVPKYVYFIDEFPLTGAGKIAKYKLVSIQK
ncbi:MAG: AMP-binding protein [Desulfobacterales bacterium]